MEFVVLSVLQEWGSGLSPQDQQELHALKSPENPFEAFFVADDPTMGIVGCAGIVGLGNAICELRKIYLLKRFRGLSIGQQLLDVCLQAAHDGGYKTMRLQINQAMAMFSPFYLRNGFVLASENGTEENAPELVYYKTL